MTNVDEADATVVFPTAAAPATDKTALYALTGRWPATLPVPLEPGMHADDAYRPTLILDPREDATSAAARLRRFVENNDVRILNVVGPAERAQQSVVHAGSAAALDHPAVGQTHAVPSAGAHYVRDVMALAFAPAALRGTDVSDPNREEHARESPARERTAHPRGVDQPESGQRPSAPRSKNGYTSSHTPEAEEPTADPVRRQKTSPTRGPRAHDKPGRIESFRGRWRRVDARAYPDKVFVHLAVAGEDAGSAAAARADRPSRDEEPNALTLRLQAPGTDGWSPGALKHLQASVAADLDGLEKALNSGRTVVFEPHAVKTALEALRAQAPHAHAYVTARLEVLGAGRDRGVALPAAPASLGAGLMAAKRSPGQQEHALSTFDEDRRLFTAYLTALAGAGIYRGNAEAAADDALRQSLRVGARRLIAGAASHGPALPPSQLHTLQPLQEVHLERQGGAIRAFTRSVEDAGERTTSLGTVTGGAAEWLGPLLERGMAPRVYLEGAQLTAPSEPGALESQFTLIVVPDRDALRNYLRALKVEPPPPTRDLTLPEVDRLETSYRDALRVGALPLPWQMRLHAFLAEHDSLARLAGAAQRAQRDHPGHADAALVLTRFAVVEGRDGGFRDPALLTTSRRAGVGSADDLIQKPAAPHVVHARHVRWALERGLAVPEDVLVDHPDVAEYARRPARAADVRQLVPAPSPSSPRPAPGTPAASDIAITERQPMRPRVVRGIPVAFERDSFQRGTTGRQEGGRRHRTPPAERVTPADGERWQAHLDAWRARPAQARANDPFTPPPRAYLRLVPPSTPVRPTLHVTGAVSSRIEQAVVRGEPEGAAISSRAHYAKDLGKARLATQMIGEGAGGSATAFYARHAGTRANTGSYTINDVVFVSANGARTGRVAPVDPTGRLHGAYQYLDRALRVGAAIVTDAAPDRNRLYNVGEREIASYLHRVGYREVGSGVWAPAAVARLTAAPYTPGATDLTAEQALASVHLARNVLALVQYRQLEEAYYAASPGERVYDDFFGTQSELTSEEQSLLQDVFAADHARRSATLDTRLTERYDNPTQARARLEAMLEKHGLAGTLRHVWHDPEILGALNADGRTAWRSARRARASDETESPLRPRAAGLRLSMAYHPHLHGGTHLGQAISDFAVARAMAAGLSDTENLAAARRRLRALDTAMTDAFGGEAHRALERLRRIGEAEGTDSAVRLLRSEPQRIAAVIDADTDAVARAATAYLDVVQLERAAPAAVEAARTERAVADYRSQLAILLSRMETRPVLEETIRRDARLLLGSVPDPNQPPTRLAQTLARTAAMVRGVAPQVVRDLTSNAPALPRPHRGIEH